MSSIVAQSAKDEAKLELKIKIGVCLNHSELRWCNVVVVSTLVIPTCTQKSPRPAQLGAVLWYVCQCDGKYPERTTQLLAYQTIVIREARCCGGRGWQGYDRMFRRLATSSPGLDWSQLNSSLFAVMFLAQQNGKCRRCRFCLETDYSDEEFVLAPIAPQAQQLYQCRAKVHRLDRTPT